MKNELIPVFGKNAKPAYEHDKALVCVAINHLFNKTPEIFGNLETRGRIKDEIGSYLTTYGSWPHMLGTLGYIFEKYDVNPFGDIRLAYLGGEPMGKGLGVFSMQTRKLRSMFNAFANFNPKINFGVSLDTVDEVIAEGKYDVVISGNVLNLSSINAPSIMMAVAATTKEGGLIVHGLGYGNCNYEIILHEAFYKNVCSHEELGRYNPQQLFAGGGTYDAVVFKQASEISSDRLKMMKTSRLALQ